MNQTQHYIVEIRFVHIIYLMSVKFIHCFLHTLDVVHTINPGEAGNESSIPFGWRQERTFSAWEHIYHIRIKQCRSGRGWDKYKTLAEYRKEKFIHLNCKINSYMWSIFSERVLFMIPKENSTSWANLYWCPRGMEGTFHFIVAFTPTALSCSLPV